MLLRMSRELWSVSRSPLGCCFLDLDMAGLLRPLRAGTITLSSLAPLHLSYIILGQSGGLVSEFAFADRPESCDLDLSLVFFYEFTYSIIFFLGF